MTRCSPHYPSCYPAFRSNKADLHRVMPYPLNRRRLCVKKYGRFHCKRWGPQSNPYRILWTRGIWFVPGFRWRVSK